MSIIEDKRGQFEIKSVIEEMYHCREDEIINLPRESEKSIDVEELMKLPSDIREDIINRAHNQWEKISDMGENEGMSESHSEILNKRFYTTGFKDGVIMILESLM